MIKISRRRKSKICVALSNRVRSVWAFNLRLLNYSPTLTVLFLLPTSYFTYKRNLVSCLINQSFLCSYENFHTQFEVVRKLIKSNGFPSHMFDRIFRCFADQTFGPEPPILTASKKIIYFCLPFTGIHSLQIRTQVN